VHRSKFGPFVPTNVLIRFEDGLESFTVPPSATLAFISERLHRVSRWHEGKALSIDLHFQAAELASQGHEAPSR
jgi:hypothetical protein